MRLRRLVLVVIHIKTSVAEATGAVVAPYTAVVF